MKIALAQIQSTKGDIQSNIEKHLAWVTKSLSQGVDAIFFPELSLTGYEPILARELAIAEDARLNEFQRLSNQNNLVIGLGAPTKSGEDCYISMLIFQPNSPLKVYSKIILHEDEQPFFSASHKQVIIQSQGIRIAPAICYESLQESHLATALHSSPDIYLASVAKSQKGINQAQAYFSLAASQHQLPILMANAIGPNDDFISAGQSSIWHKNGELIAQLSTKEEGLLIYDTKTKAALSLQ